MIGVVVGEMFGANQGFGYLIAYYGSVVKATDAQRAVDTGPGPEDPDLAHWRLADRQFSGTLLRIGRTQSFRSGRGERIQRHLIEAGTALIVVLG
jgi:hypothetical protein